LRKATGAKTRDVYLEFVFTDVKVHEYRLSIGSDGVPKETVKFTFKKVRMSYKPQKAGGELEAAVRGGWDLPGRSSWTGD
jgi:type VI protein secretion system component Hcp